MRGWKKHLIPIGLVTLSVIILPMPGSIGSALAKEVCPSGSERQAIPNHLQDLTATAVTIDGPGGITIDVVAHPLPPYLGNPWSHWGEGLLASNGNFYTGIGDHRGTDGNSFLYEYDPDTKVLHAVGDVLQAYGKHDNGAWGYGKIHGRISEGHCGLLYFSTYWGTRRGGLQYTGSYQGDLLMRYDPESKELVSLGVPMPTMGTPSTQIWQEGGLFYGEANHPVTKDTDWPKGKLFWVYDLAKQKVIFTSKTMIGQGSGREIAVDREGNAYYGGAGRELLRYNPKTNVEGSVAIFPYDGKLRASSRLAPDGKIFLTTNREHRAYLFDPLMGDLADLGPLPADTASLALSANGEEAYFSPGAHGQGLDLGFPLMAINRNGEIRTIVKLGPLIEKAGESHPAGTYSISTDPARPGNVYILANAGPVGSSEEAFGRPMVIAVYLPEAIR